MHNYQGTMLQAINLLEHALQVPAWVTNDLPGWRDAITAAADKRTINKRSNEFMSAFDDDHPFRTVVKPTFLA